MKRSESFMLCRLAGVPYLLPFGQKIADHKRGIQINDTGCYLWELLANERSYEELLKLYLARYSSPLTSPEQLRSDLAQFLASLRSFGMLEDSADKHSHAPAPCPLFQHIRLGGLTLRLSGPREAFSDSFRPFFTDIPFPVHQQISVFDFPPPEHQNGKVILRNEELIIMDSGSCYILFFPACHSQEAGISCPPPRIYEASLAKDGSEMCLYCRPPFTEALREQIFHILRISFLYLAQKHHMIALHSASVLYRDRLWLFCGHSGAGKSTHAGLWNSLFSAPIINGDLNLLSFKDEEIQGTAPGSNSFKVHGLPWCGTSGISHTGSYEPGGIILLKRAGQNYAEQLSPSKKQLLIAQRCISPSWNAEMQLANLHLAEAAAQSLFVCRLHCTKDTAAAETMKQVIDSCLEQPKKGPTYD